MINAIPTRPQTLRAYGSERRAAAKVAQAAPTPKTNWRKLEMTGPGWESPKRYRARMCAAKAAHANAMTVRRSCIGTSAKRERTPFIHLIGGVLEKSVRHG